MHQFPNKHKVKHKLLNTVVKCVNGSVCLNVSQDPNLGQVSCINNKIVANADFAFKMAKIAVKNLPEQHFDQRIKVTETKKFSLLGFIEVAISFGQVIEHSGHEFQCVLVTRTNSFGNFDQIRLAWNPP